MADYVSPEARRRIATGLMAAQYAENPPAAPMGYDWNAAPLSPSLMNFAAQRGQPGVIQKTLGLIPGFDQDGARGRQSWGNALMSTAQFPIDAVAGIGQALTAPARAYRGEFDPVSEEGVGEALNVAGNAMLGGFAAPKPAGVVGSAGGSLKAFPDGIKREWAPGGERVEIYTPETKPYPMGGNKFPDRTGFTDEPLAPAFDLKPRSDGSGEWVWPFTEADEALTKRYGSRAAPDLYANGGRSGAATGAALGAIPDTPVVTGYRGSAYSGKVDGPAFWASSDPTLAGDYAKAHAKEARGRGSSGENITPAEFKFNNPMNIDASGETWANIPFRGNRELSDNIARIARDEGFDGLVINNLRDGVDSSASSAPQTTIAALQRGTVYSPLTGDLLYANGGRPGAATGAALGAIPDTPGIRATNISDISTAGPLPNRILAYHGAASKFDNLDLARAPDVGLHYGTLDVTDQFSGFRDYGDKRGVRAPDNSRIYPVILDGSRMARAADGALFDETAQAHSFLDAVKKGKIEGVTNATPGFADLERNMSALPYGDASANPIVRDWLTSNGLDGVIYPNTYDGSGVSAMMWKNVRSALGNNDLLYANGGRGGAATGAALGAIPDTPGIRAYHGSPHDFDKFDLSKIGTGEGAQAYGHGLYFAENEGVARSYRDTTSGKNANVAVQTNGVRQLIGMLQKNPAELEQALRGTAAHMNASGTEAGRIGAQEAIAVADSIRAGTFKAGSGRMYEVNIKASPDDFLDWDKRLGEQSANVRDKVKSLMLASREIPDDPAGAYKQAIERYNAGPKATALTDDPGVIQAYDAMRLARKGDKAFDRQKIGALLQESGRWSPEDARRTFLDAGIPGIKYLDRGSRTAGDGTSNYVVFDDKLIEILRKYGLLGMAGGAAAAEYGFGAPQSRPASPQYRPGDA